MSVQWSKRVWVNSKAKNAARLVLLCLADHADDGTGACHPGRKCIARETRLTDRPVDHALQWLVKNGELTIEVGAGPMGCNRYRILLPPVNSTPPADSTPPRQIDGPPPVKLTQNPPLILRPKPSGTIKEPSDKAKARATLAECKAYAVECNLPESDGEAFFNAKEGNGWKNGKNPVKDWKATFRNWQDNHWHPSQKVPGLNGHAHALNGKRQRSTD